jgi:hypothetical protein
VAGLAGTVAAAVQVPDGGGGERRRAEEEQVVLGPAHGGQRKRDPGIVRHQLATVTSRRPRPAQDPRRSSVKLRKFTMRGQLFHKLD